MSIFDKTSGLEIVNLFRRAKLYPFFRKLEGSRGSNVLFQNKELIMMGSNNYLGLTHHPEVMEASIQAVKRWGTGCTGSRFLNGNLALHEELESELADFLGFESCVVFASGFMANQGAIGALVSAGEHIFSDKDNHACIIEGCMLSRARFHSYRHGNMEHLDRLLKKTDAHANKLIITDGVFSMTGRLAPYDRIFELAKEHGATTYIDDAHGLGVVGKGGRGTANHFNLPVDILMGTFSKSLASQGGYICGSGDAIDWIKHKARTFMFSAALAPASTAAAQAALRILRSSPEMVDHLLANAKYLKEAFNSLGLNTMGTQTSVVPVFIGDDRVALKICQQLLELGVFTTPVVYPAVPKGEAVIRCSLMATHTRTDLNRAIDAFTYLAPAIKEANASPDKTALLEYLDKPEMVKAGFSTESQKVVTKNSLPL